MPPNAIKAPPQATSLRDGFRIFTHEPPLDNPTQLTACPQRELTNHGEPLSIFVGSAVGRNNNGLTISGGGLWYGVDDPRNISFRTQEDEPQNVQTAEIIATVLAFPKNIEGTSPHPS
jgi:hypothetical protein